MRRVADIFERTSNIIFERTVDRWWFVPKFASIMYFIEDANVEQWMAFSRTSRRMVRQPAGISRLKQLCVPRTNLNETQLPFISQANCRRRPNVP